MIKSGPAAPELSYHEVKRADFLISIVEGGTLEAVNAVVIRNEVEGTARIIFIVPEGSYVKKGDLLVELDSSASQDAVNQQQINVEKAQFALIQAEQQLDIQKSTVDSETAAAKLKVEFAESGLEKFIKGEADQTLRNAQIEITNVLETLNLAEERFAWTQKLYDKGFETKSNLDRDRLSVSQNTLKLEQARKALWMIETFDNPKKKRELEATLQEAKENLERVKLQGESKLAQFRADVETQKSTLELSKKKLERDLRQLAATKICAPQDGLVVYASGGGHFSSESMIEEGAVVRNRQELIRLPDISDMKLTVKIHESHINQISLGQPAYVVLDAMPDRRFNGVIRKVAPLPDSQSRYGNPNLKVYATEILITEELPNVKPGVSARAEILITNLEKVLTVPIQCVTTRKGQQVVFLDTAPQTPVPVSVGMYNIKYIEITSGLKPSDRVLLSPPFDTQDKDLAGAIVAKGEKVPVQTNQPPRLSREEEGFGPGRNSGGGRGKRDQFGAPGEGRFGRGSSEGAGEGGPGGFERGPGRRRSDGEAGAGPGAGPGTGAGFNREEFLKRFDVNGDGQLDENEKAAMREAFGKNRPPRPGTNAVPGQIPPPPNAGR
jgi:HlyD family secretion protein